VFRVFVPLKDAGAILAALVRTFVRDPSQNGGLLKIVSRRAYRSEPVRSGHRALDSSGGWPTSHTITIGVPHFSRCLREVGLYRCKPGDSIHHNYTVLSVTERPSNRD
jgi:hypothetical protein